MNLPSSAAQHVIFTTFLLLSSVVAYPNGAGSCPGGVTAVGGSHLNASTVVNGTLEEGGFTVDIGGNILVPGNVTNFTADDFHLVFLTGTTDYFKGFLLRLEWLNGSGRESTVFALSPDEFGLNDTQIEETCIANNVGGITHTASDDKFSTYGFLSVAELGDLALDVTVVVASNTTLSTFYYSRYVISAVGGGAFTSFPTLTAFPSFAPFPFGFASFPSLSPFPSVAPVTAAPVSSLSFEVEEQFLSIGPYNNESTHHYIPPDPNGAVSKTTLVATVNDVIEIRTKKGVILYQSNFSAFFSSLATHNESKFADPKVVYDEYEDRFVLVVLNLLIDGRNGADDGERFRSRRHLQNAATNSDSTNISLKLLAVSKNGSPTNGESWFFQAIDTLEYNTLIDDLHGTTTRVSGWMPDRIFLLNGSYSLLTIL